MDCLETSLLMKWYDVVCHKARSWNDDGFGTLAPLSLLFLSQFDRLGYFFCCCCCCFSSFGKVPLAGLMCDLCATTACVCVSSGLSAAFPVQLLILGLSLSLNYTLPFFGLRSDSEMRRLQPRRQDPEKRFQQRRPHTLHDEKTGTREDVINVF